MQQQVREQTRLEHDNPADVTAEAVTESAGTAQSTAAHAGAQPGPEPACPVHSWNEWGLLEEVIVGRIDGAVTPAYHISASYNLPPMVRKLLWLFGGRRYPGFVARHAQRELDEFIHILEAEGIRVRRPEPIDFSRSFRTPEWKSRGFAVACPRDSVLIIGDEIIETPMPWRCRHFETFAYRPLFKEYFNHGARWTAAPRPQLLDDLYDYDYTLPMPGEPLRYVTNEFEPVFDAADFIRCGRDLFVTRSNVTNQSGIEWLRRHLGDGFRIHEVKTLCRDPMHIDSTMLPLAPGKMLVNPEYADMDNLPPVLKQWDLLIAPQPDPLPAGRTRLSMVSKWISINVLSLDEERVVVEKSQTSMIKALKDWGFKPIPCDFVGYGPYGGAFHCATLDIRRHGELESYF